MNEPGVGGRPRNRSHPARVPTSIPRRQTPTEFPLGRVAHRQQETLDRGDISKSVVLARGDNRDVYTKNQVRGADPRSHETRLRTRGTGIRKGEPTGFQTIDIRTTTDAIATPRVGGGTDRVTGWKTAPPTERVRHRAGTRRNGGLTQRARRAPTTKRPAVRGLVPAGEVRWGKRRKRERGRGGGEERPRCKSPASLVSHDGRRTAPERKDLPAPFSTLDPNVETPSAAAEVV